MGIIVSLRFLECRKAFSLSIVICVCIQRSLYYRVDLSLRLSAEAASEAVWKASQG
jgi:hypothetical protein